VVAGLALTAAPALAAVDPVHEVWTPPLWGTLPFLVQLVAIALFPLLPATARWWHHNKNKFLVSCILGIPVIGWIWGHDHHQVTHTAVECAQFVILLAALFIGAGGLHLKGDLKATPAANALFLLVGYVLASVIGTTGASMLLIYPLLRTNSERHKTAHVFIFFIFMVCNAGGLLTPIGDPPLFLGYLRGIDFSWFLKLTPMWLMTGAGLLFVFYLLDSWYYRRETQRNMRADATQVEPLRLIGGWNVLFLLFIVGSVALSKFFADLLGRESFSPFREIVMIAAAAASLLYSKNSPVAAEARKRNHFSFNAIVEVAVVFFGIFATMMPALLLLNIRGGELGVNTPLKFFYVTGAFSSVLDNAPAFVCFLTLGQGVGGIEQAAGMMSPEMNAGLGCTPALILAAISLGAVFMGANTYIGNAPNFMVRSICEEQGVKMPSFFGYTLWAAVILLPLFSLVAWLFLVKLSFPLF
jgi:Na+/H+ antiporter NhaD/arsenite permease-like protein